MKANPKKRRLRVFLIVKEAFMVTLAVLCLAGLALEHLEQLNPHQLAQLEVFEIIVGAVFLVEFGFELYFAKNRKKYWRRHWYFLLAGVPVPMQAFDILRGLRILRLLRLLKVFTHLRYERNTWLFQAQRP